MSNKITRRKLPLINEEGEVRVLTREDMALFKPAAEVLPASLLKKLGICPKITKEDSGKHSIPN